MTQDLALYIHWPFCKFKCPYCDFNSHVRAQVTHADWRVAYQREMQFYYDQTGPRRLTSVFFGGGTPSLMEAETVHTVLNEADRLWGLPTNIEITLEANPTSAEVERLRNFKSAGINRVSLGVQALEDSALRQLGRQHSAAEALAAVEMASKIFEKYSFDLIYARPDQTVDAWRQELRQALSYAAGHMSLYQLTIEEGTQYHTLYHRGALKIPDEETAAALYELTQDMMEAVGLPAYEVSNHAKAGHESQHNLVYWRYGDYAGIGPGAHGRLTLTGEKKATRAHRAPEIWLTRVKDVGHGAHPFETVLHDKRGIELVMMGLRLAEGISLSRLEEETGSRWNDLIPPNNIHRLECEGLLSFDSNRLIATKAGRQRLNAVLKFLLNRD